MGVKIKFNQKALEQVVHDAVESAAYDATYDIECPHCGKAINIQPGHSTCPHCGNEIELNLNIQF